MPHTNQQRPIRCPLACAHHCRATHQSWPYLPRRSVTRCSGSILLLQHRWPIVFSSSRRGMAYLVACHRNSVVSSELTGTSNNTYTEQLSSRTELCLCLPVAHSLPTISLQFVGTACAVPKTIQLVIVIIGGNIMRHLCWHSLRRFIN